MSFSVAIQRLKILRNVNKYETFLSLYETRNVYQTDVRISKKEDNPSLYILWNVQEDQRCVPQKMTHFSQFFLKIIHLWSFCTLKVVILFLTFFGVCIKIEKSVWVSTSWNECVFLWNLRDTFCHCHLLGKKSYCVVSNFQRKKGPSVHFQPFNPLYSNP